MFWKKQPEAPPPPPPAAPEEAEAERTLTAAQHAERLNVCIDAFMVHFCDYKDPAERTDEHGRRHFQRGSASGIAWVAVDGEGDEESCTFHCAALVMPLPSDRELLLPLYRELLEVNWDIVGVVRLAVMKSDVWALYSERADRLESPLQVASAIDHVMGLTDGLDDRLMQKYGGTSAKV